MLATARATQRLVRARPTGSTPSKPLPQLTTAAAKGRATHTTTLSPKKHISSLFSTASTRETGTEGPGYAAASFALGAIAGSVAMTSGDSKKQPSTAIDQLINRSTVVAENHRIIHNIHSTCRYDHDGKMNRFKEYGEGVRNWKDVVELAGSALKQTSQTKVTIIVDQLKVGGGMHPPEAALTKLAAEIALLYRNRIVEFILSDDSLETPESIEVTDKGVHQVRDTSACEKFFSSAEGKKLQQHFLQHHTQYKALFEAFSQASDKLSQQDKASKADLFEATIEIYNDTCKTAADKVDVGQRVAFVRRLDAMSRAMNAHAIEYAHDEYASHARTLAKEALSSNPVALALSKLPRAGDTIFYPAWGQLGRMSRANMQAVEHGEAALDTKVIGVARGTTSREVTEMSQRLSTSENPYIDTDGLSVYPPEHTPDLLRKYRPQIIFNLPGNALASIMTPQVVAALKEIGQESSTAVGICIKSLIVDPENPNQITTPVEYLERLLGDTVTIATIAGLYIAEDIGEPNRFLHQGIYASSERSASTIARNIHVEKGQKKDVVVAPKAELYGVLGGVGKNVFSFTASLKLAAMALTPDRVVTMKDIDNEAKENFRQTTGLTAAYFARNGKKLHKILQEKIDAGDFDAIKSDLRGCLAPTPEVYQRYRKLFEQAISSMSTTEIQAFIDYGFNGKKTASRNGRDGHGRYAIQVIFRALQNNHDPRITGKNYEQFKQEFFPKELLTHPHEGENTILALEAADDMILTTEMMVALVAYEDTRPKKEATESH